jgi:hypothetical protein
MLHADFQVCRRLRHYNLCVVNTSRTARRLLHAVLIAPLCALQLFGIASPTRAQTSAPQPEAFTCSVPLTAGATPIGMSGDYIRRVGNELRDGASTKPFKFVSFNASNGVTSDYLERTGEGVETLQTTFAQEDLVKTAYQLSGGRGGVLRLYTLTIAQPSSAGRYRHLMTLPVDKTDNNEEKAWRSLDRFMCFANKYRVRVIVPLINFHFEDFAAGGGDDFAALVKPSLGKERAALGKAFYGDPAVKQQFKAFVSYALTRRNVFTGQRYVDDKAVLGWQLGNELFNLDNDDCVEGACPNDVADWIKEMARHIKSVKRSDGSAPLVIDPRLAFTEGLGGLAVAFNVTEPAKPNYWSAQDLELIDVLSNHYYKFNEGSSYSKRLADDLASLPAAVRASKALVIDEIGMNPFQVDTALAKLRGDARQPGLDVFLDDVIKTPGVAGALFWDLAPRHDRNPVSGARGGFQSLREYPEPSYFRWPGFSESFADPKSRNRELYREIDLLKLIWLKSRSAAAASYGTRAPAPADWGAWDISQDQPRMLADGAKRTPRGVQIVWAGVTGARFYRVSRQEKTGATWGPTRVINENAQDGAADGSAQYPGAGTGFAFLDETAATAKAYRYFIRAKTPASPARLSAWSCALEIDADSNAREDCTAKAPN